MEKKHVSNCRNDLHRSAREKCRGPQSSVSERNERGCRRGGSGKSAPERHDKDNDSFGLVFGNYDGEQTIWYAGGDIDSSTYMIRFPARRTTVIVLSNDPLGDSEERTMRILKALHAAGIVN